MMQQWTKVVVKATYSIKYEVADKFLPIYYKNRLFCRMFLLCVFCGALYVVLLESYIVEFFLDLINYLGLNILTLINYLACKEGQSWAKFN